MEVNDERINTTQDEMKHCSVVKKNGKLINCFAGKRKIPKTKNDHEGKHEGRAAAQKIWPKLSLPSSGFTKPELFQSNCAAGTDALPTVATCSGSSAMDSELGAAGLLAGGQLALFSEEPASFADTDAAPGAVAGFSGSSGLKLRLAANRGIELFHFGPYICKWEGGRCCY